MISRRKNKPNIPHLRQAFCEPIEGGIRVAATNAFFSALENIVVLIARSVVLDRLLLNGFMDQFHCELYRTLLGRKDRDFKPLRARSCISLRLVFARVSSAPGSTST